jgi:hypothetical protein
LSAIAAAQTKAGMAGDAAATMDEALEVMCQAFQRAAGVTQFLWIGLFYIPIVCDIGKAQAEAGLPEKATATSTMPWRLYPQLGTQLISRILPTANVRRG